MRYIILLLFIHYYRLIELNCISWLEDGLSIYYNREKEDSGNIWGKELIIYRNFVSLLFKIIKNIDCHIKLFLINSGKYLTEDGDFYLYRRKKYRLKMKKFVKSGKYKIVQN